MLVSTVGSHCHCDLLVCPCLSRVSLSIVQLMDQPASQIVNFQTVCNEHFASVIMALCVVFCLVERSQTAYDVVNRCVSIM